MKKTIVINLIGAPGAGKSTLAALVFSKLKMENISSEIVTEFAKDLVWDNSNGLNNQLYVFSGQFYRVWRLQNAVDVVVTDSPMILSIYYNMLQKPDNKLSEDLFNKLVLECNNKFININFFLKRKHNYKTDGRIHSEADSIRMEQEMQYLYQALDIPYTTLNSTDTKNADYIVMAVKGILNKLSPEVTRDSQELER